MDRVTIVNIKDWRKVRTRTITTRSGLSVVLRRDVTVEDLITQGTVPLPLLQQIQGLGDFTAQPVGDMMDMIGELLPAINAVCCALVHSPHLLTVEEHRSLLAEAAAMLDVSEAVVLTWLVDDVSEAHLAGLEESLRRRLLESISIGELPMEDRLDLFNAALGGAAPLTTFPLTA